MLMNLAKYEWKINAQVNDNEQIISSLAGDGSKFSPAFLRLCAARGIRTPEELAEKTNQEPQLYHDPFFLFEMDKAIDRIQRAVMEGEVILIYGDYDADGVTSTLILYEALEAIGAHVIYYLPNRLTDGYGPNKERWEALVEEHSVGLIVTCDNGVTGHEAIDRMNDLDVDVVVTDHHEIQETLPAAYAVIHPNHPEGNYPFKDLSGAGVALKVASALLSEIPVESLELAAIGTVADMVSLTDENRTIVLSGLNLMRNSHRLGLQLLLEEEKVRQESIDTQTIGFIIGPRLNAIGRLGDPSPALELLRTFDPNEARQLLDLVNQKNQERQHLTRQIVVEVEEKLANYESLPNIIIEAAPHWAAGILGIVASRLVNKYQRPVILFQYQADKQQYKGSGRSVKAINLFDQLMAVKEQILYFGGHSQAAGLTVAEDQWPTFQAQLADIMQAYTEILSQPEAIEVDMPLKISEITPEFIEEVDRLGPFGMDNERPVFLIENANVEQIRVIGADQTHIKLALSDQSQQTLQVIGFSKAEQCQDVQAGSKVSLIGELSLNEWNGNVSPQMQLTDLGQEGSQWIDYRGSKIPPELLQLTYSVFAFNHQAVAEHMRKQIHSSNEIILFGNHLLVDKQYKQLVIMETPDKLERLTKLIQDREWEKIYLGAYVQDSRYLAGLPTRQEFTQLYKLLIQQKEIDIKNDSAKLAQRLNISPIKLKAIYLMFLEAKFVTMENGRLIQAEYSAGKVDIPSLASYKAYKDSMDAEAFLTYQSLDKIKNYFEGNGR